MSLNAHVCTTCMHTDALVHTDKFMHADVLVHILMYTQTNSRTQMYSCAHSCAQTCSCICRCGRVHTNTPIIDRVLINAAEDTRRFCLATGRSPAGFSHILYTSPVPSRIAGTVSLLGIDTQGTRKTLVVRLCADFAMRQHTQRLSGTRRYSRLAPAAGLLCARE
jgi:hypothetical protein